MLMKKGPPVRAKKKSRPLPHPSGQAIFSVRGPTQTDQFRPIQTSKWIDPVEMPRLSSWLLATRRPTLPYTTVPDRRLVARLTFPPRPTGTKASDATMTYASPIETQRRCGPLRSTRPGPAKLRARDPRARGTSLDLSIKRVLGQLLNPAAVRYGPSG
jgi:hypothetical protein